MDPIANAWFAFDGDLCSHHGLRLAALPVRPIPAPRGRRVTVPGRDGSLWLPDGASEDIELRVEAVSDGSADPADLAAWLAREGYLRFSDEPDRAYLARCVSAVPREAFLPRLAGWRLTVAFLCAPFRWHWPKAEEFAVPASGSAVVNPGTAPARPRLRLLGSGQCTASVGGCAMEFADVSGSVVIDCALQEVFVADGITSAAGQATLEAFPALTPGPNLVTWGGGATGMRVLPEWRDL